MKFKNREQAGEILASQLEDYQHAEDVLVLGLPCGGVPVADKVAEKFGAPLDVFIVRKVGVPGQEELAMGAVASGGVVAENPNVLRSLRISTEMFTDVAEQQKEEVRRREEMYRGHRTGLAIEGRTVILVDDGLATGASMRAAVEAVKTRQPKRIVVAVPVAARDTAEAFRETVDEFVCVNEADSLDGVGRWYEDFSQTTDDDVREFLDRAGERRPEEVRHR